MIFGANKSIIHFLAVVWRLRSDNDDPISHPVDFKNIGNFTTATTIKELIIMSLWDEFHDQYDKKAKKQRNRRGFGKENSKLNDENTNVDGTISRSHGCVRISSRRPQQKLPSTCSWPTLLNLPTSSAQQMHHDHYHQHRRRSHQRFGERLAQRRAFGLSSSSASSRESTVVYRRDEDWASQQTYVNALFLNNDTALAADMTGKIDILRLPSSSSSGAGAGISDTKLLASRLEALPSLKGTSTFKLKRIKDGNAFVVGMPWGKFNIFSSERDFDLNSSSSTSIPSKICNFTQKQQQSLSYHYIQSAISIHNPRRKYYRDYSSTNGTLSSIITNTNNDVVLPQRSEIPNWENVLLVSSFSSSSAPPLPYFFPQQRPSNHSSLWDFHEASTGALLSLHINQEFDSFSLMRIGDHRMKSVPSSSSFPSSLVGIDLTSKDAPSSYEEHFTTCTFISDNLVATAHHICPSTSSSSTSAAINMIKLWDLRMMTNNDTRQRKPQRPLDLIRLSTFPENFSVGFEPISTKSIAASQHDEENRIYRGINSSEIVTGLSSSKGSSNGNLMVTLKKTTRTSSNGSGRRQPQQRRPSPIVEHRVFDLGRMEFTRSVQQCNSNLESIPTYSISGSNKFMACHTTGSNSTNEDDPSNNDASCNDTAKKKKSIAIYDLTKTSSSRGKSKLRSKMGMNSAGTKLQVSGQKRGANSRDGGSRSSGKTAMIDSCMVSHQWNPILNDRYGLETSLSCMEMDYDGTALLGGTVDGDLFLWR